MKTAISVPDDLFQKAERLAKRTKKSRSQLFSDALREYLARHVPDEVTDAMNRTMDQVGEEANGFTAEAARRVLKGSDW